MELTMTDGMTPLSATQTAELLTVADLLGHDRERLLGGEQICTYGELTNLAQARRVLSRATPAARRLRAATFFDAIRDRQDIGQGLHDRGEAACFAEGEIPASDAAGHRRHFPVKVRLMSVMQQVVAAGQTLDVSVRGDRWGVDEMEELYTVVNIGRLVLEPGARVIVRGNVFSLTCQVIRLLGAPHGPRGTERGCHIAILPTPFPVDYGSGPVDGEPGVTGSAGSAGSAGFAPRPEQGLLGPMLPSGVRAEAMTGGAGKPGEPGGMGGRGRNGGMAKLAELTIRSFEGPPLPLVVLARGGTGGDGGPGGPGGDGAHGGQSLTGPVRGGNGGDGGPGGDAGRGGHPGNGGLASNVYLTVPPGEEHRVLPVSVAGQPGRPGDPGRPGRGGQGGRAGTGPAGHEGTSGRDGPAGNPGISGRLGRIRTPPAIFVNDRLGIPVCAPRRQSDRAGS